MLASHLDLLLLFFKEAAGTPWRFLKLTNCCLVDLTDVTLAFEDASSKIVEVVTVADVDAEKHVDDSWCRFGHKAKSLFGL